MNRPRVAASGDAGAVANAMNPPAVGNENDMAIMQAYQGDPQNEVANSNNEHDDDDAANLGFVEEQKNLQLIKEDSANGENNNEEEKKAEKIKQDRELLEAKLLN